MAHLHLDQRILIAIFPLDGLFRVRCRLAQERIVVGHVLEHNQAVIFWVDALLHGNHTELVGKDSVFLTTNNPIEKFRKQSPNANLTHNRL